VAEVPEGGAELKRVLRCAPGGRLAFGRQTAERLVHLSAVQGGTELDHAIDLDRSSICFRVPDADRDHDRLARAHYAFFTVDGEVGFAGIDRESLLLVRMDVLGDRSAGQAAPPEPDNILTAPFCNLRELDPLARCGVGERAKWRGGDGLGVGPVRDGWIGLGYDRTLSLAGWGVPF
jgi:hypothetical protein